MKKILLIYCVFLTIIISPILCIFSIFIKEKSDIKIICQNLKLIDGNVDHNRALDVINRAREKGITIPEIIINFDTHSDIFMNKEINPIYGARIYDWINEYFLENPGAEELYWVWPEEAVKDEKLQKSFVMQDCIEYPTSVALFGNYCKKPEGINPEIDKIPYVQYFLVNTKNTIVREFIDNEDEKLLKMKNSPYRKFKLVNCTEKSLPDFKDKNVFLSIDFDYISNSGYDTTEDFKNNRTSVGIVIAINKMLATIVNKNIRPEIISLTISPQYVPEEDEWIIYNYIQKFIKKSGHKDELQEYTYHRVYPKVMEGQDKYISF